MALGGWAEGGERAEPQVTKVLNSPVHVPRFFIPPVDGKV